MGDGIKKALALAVLLAGAGAYLAGPVSGGARGQQTRSGDAPAKWRPARDYTGLRYVGADVCAACHAKESAAQPETPMGRAARRASDCDILKARPRMTFRDGPYIHEIRREGAGSVYSVTDGSAAVSEQILFCFGEGAAGQTYVFRRAGTFYESRVSYFNAVGGLDLTIEHPRAAPASLEAALGRPMSREAARGCFACHTTPTAVAASQELERVSPGVSCEACHGPGERHLAALKAKDSKNLQIFNPARLDPLDLSQEFCGACHQSFDTVMGLEGQGGAANIRFQPYRIFNSRAHLLNDRRMSCTACHDPHGPLERDPVRYDANCLSCHVSTPAEKRTRARSAPPCPVSARGCVSCHMPKVELPSMHFRFTDHWIRVARPGAPVPR